MASIKAFRGLRPRADIASKLSELPYDVCNSEEAREISAGNEYNFYHITKPEIDLPKDTDPYSSEVYSKAAENFKAFVEKGYLVEDEKELLYLYTLTMNGRTQTGLVTVVSVDDYDKGVIKKHELTRQAKEDDRIRHIDSVNAQTGPVFLLYKQKKEIRELFEDVLKNEPLYEFTSNDGVYHALRAIRADDQIASLVEYFDCLDLYIADGHHRAASAARVGRERAAKGIKDGSDYFLSVVFPDEQLYIMPYNRVVNDLNAHSKDEFFELLSKKYKIEATKNKTPLASSSVAMYIDSEWYMLTPLFEISSDPVESLDVQILQKQVLSPILGIDDPRVSERIDFVGGIRGTDELERLVDSGNFAVAFSMYPTTIDQLISVSDSGLVMPPKSTWFEPKLRSGMVIHAFKK
ncbi:MAG: DUF1015 domain-containing protein [Spirochaetes bacterium]|nr:DUF1015 domain-containing protein [Spirochaetota bacterium]MBN2772509.1 DUF1015 domain-containing protein [Spirochaetota bacterium]